MFPSSLPRKNGRKVGQVPNVVFVEGMVRKGERFLFYYGGADANVGVAEAPVLSKGPRVKAESPGTQKVYIVLILM